MKVLLIVVDFKFIYSNLVVRYLKNFIRDFDYEVKIKEFIINDREGRILEEIIKEKLDIVVFLIYIWNVEFILRIVNLIKRVNFNIEILYGGLEVLFDLRIFLKNNVGEYVIEGEGEKIYRDFILYKLGEVKLEDVKGFYYKIDDVVYFNEKCLFMFMDEIVFLY